MDIFRDDLGSLCRSETNVHYRLEAPGKIPPWPTPTEVTDKLISQRARHVFCIEEQDQERRQAMRRANARFFNFELTQAVLNRSHGSYFFNSLFSKSAVMTFATLLANVRSLREAWQVSRAIAIMLFVRVPFAEAYPVHEDLEAAE